MSQTQPHPLLLRAVPAAEELYRQEHFSVENLCHALDCGLKELGDAIGSIDNLVLHVNDRFMAGYQERAKAVDQQAGDDHLSALRQLSLAWLEYAQGNPQLMKVLLQHRWGNGFERPDWYLARVNACFTPVEGRLAKLAPQAPPQAVAAASRAIYAQISGLYFLGLNERATPAGIASQQQLLQTSVTWLAQGLAKAS